MIDTTVLTDLLSRFRYKPGWSFNLDCTFSTSRPNLLITLHGPDSVNGGLTKVVHATPLPSFTPPERWEDWLLETILKIETHEACEFFTVDDAAPYFPEHGSSRAYQVRRREKPFPVKRPEGERVVQMIVPGPLEASYVRR
jgi:hypothetical protein